MRYFVFIVALFVGLSASAQNVERVRHNLLNGSESGGRVVVLEGDGVNDAVTAVESHRHSRTIEGYRVVIYSDNGQYANDHARSAYGGFKSHFPGISAYLVYESPYFKVSVGDCISMEEAQMLISKIQGYYPTAFPRREKISLDALKRAAKYDAEPIDSLSLPVIDAE